MKRNIIILILCLFLVGVFATTYRVQTVGADSGFDSSFDVGDSDDGDIGGLVYLIYLCIEHPVLGVIVLIVLAVLFIKSKKHTKKIIEDSLRSKFEPLDVSRFPEEKQLEIQAFNIYKELQFAWMNFDEETIRRLTTDEMYNMYLMQMDTLKVKNQKNIMYDIKYLGSNIISRKEVNGQETIVMGMQVSCYDFILDTTTNKVVRGNASKLNNYSYELTFVRTEDVKGTDICPRCGAPVLGNNSGVCEYCKSTIISSHYTLVMSKKKMLAQK